MCVDTHELNFFNFTHYVSMFEEMARSLKAVFPYIVLENAFHAKKHAVKIRDSCKRIEDCQHRLASEVNKKSCR